MDVEQEKHIKTEVIQAFDGYFEACRQLDPCRCMSYFVDTNDITVIEDSEIRPSRQVLEEWLYEFLKGVVKLDATLEERRVFPLSLEVAVATGIFQYSAQTTSGDAVGGRNAFTFVFVKSGERWQIKHAHESSLPVEK